MTLGIGPCPPAARQHATTSGESGVRKNVDVAHPSSSLSPQARAKAFLRDVCVNVLANLVAVPILYLLGVLGGVFPRSPKAIATALGATFLWIFVLLCVVSRFMRIERRIRLFPFASMTAGVGMIFGGIAGVPMMEGWPTWPTSLYGGLLLFTGVAWIYVERRSVLAARDDEV